MRTLLTLLLAFTLAACGGSDSAPATNGASSSTPNASTASAEVDQTVTIQPVGNEMRYEQAEFTVAPGETVRLVFENTATSPSMQHNVVLLTSDDDADAQRVGEEGLAAGAQANYVPDDDAVLAATPIALPGATVEVTFTAPSEPGEYRYLCTFPGHWATMQGTMRVSG